MTPDQTKHRPVIEYANYEKTLADLFVQSVVQTSKLLMAKSESRHRKRRDLFVVNYWSGVAPNDKQMQR
jgi:hypothetical protein